MRRELVGSKSWAKQYGGELNHLTTTTAMYRRRTNYMIILLLHTLKRKQQQHLQRPPVAAYFATSESRWPLEICCNLQS
uniref:Transposase n=1 Tax=Peronospora matthiolae TaxID=2874970 RepID=A0AAV1U2C6_9STRA